MNPSELISDDFLNSLDVLDWGYVEGSIPHTIKQYQDWVERGQHGPLGYLADHRQELRSDLKRVFPEFQSALVFLFSYRPTKKWMLENNLHQIASYALGFGGEDYHDALKRRLFIISERLKESRSDLEIFISLDTQPILERDLAFRAGLGWFGKNSMLINQKHGSYFIIGSLLLNKKFPISKTFTDVDHCGNCIACIDACPTKAIDPDSRTLYADKCISTFTIEMMKDTPAPSGFEKSRGEIFGCDICQDVCPWNNKTLQKITSSLQIDEKFDFLKKWFYESSLENFYEFIKNESGRSFRKKFQGTPFGRPGKEGWLKNLKAHLKI